MKTDALAAGRLRQLGDGRSELIVEQTTYESSGKGAAISYAIAPSPFGYLLVASTKHGICWGGIHEAIARLESELRRDFPEATILGANDEVSDVAVRIAASISDPALALDLPLDIRATPFQLKVWRELCAIPRRATRSYGEIARGLGRPEASRAVGHANGSNPVAILIPCHRVIGSDGRLTGYRWGVGIKQRLLEAEGALIQPRLTGAALAQMDLVN